MDNKHKNTKFIPYAFVAFFAVVFIINGIYIYLANKTWRGIYTDDSYHKGLKYNQTLEYVKSQKKLGWEFDIKYLNRGNNLGDLTVCLFGKNKSLIKDAKLLVKIIRPIQEGYDFTQNLTPQNNCYFTKINFPLKGQWSLEIQAFKGDNILQEVRRFVVR